jgi:hypothetical protein
MHVYLGLSRYYIYISPILDDGNAMMKYIFMAHHAHAVCLDLCLAYIYTRTHMRVHVWRIFSCDIFGIEIGSYSKVIYTRNKRQKRT